MRNIPESAIDTMVASVSKATIKQYESTYRLWWKYCIDDVSLYEASPKEVISFLQSIVNQRACKFGTINSYRSALSLISHQDLGDNPMIKQALYERNFPA